MPTDETRGRATYLLDGRRVLVSDLIAAGLIEVGADLEFVRPRLGEIHLAKVGQGRIELEDGHAFKSPSRAASAAAGGGSFDGWSAWRLASSHEYLDTLRQRLLDQAAVDTSDECSAEDDGQGIARRHEFLKHARLRADNNRPLELSVLELIAQWGAATREQSVSDKVSAELENHGLRTVPSFLKVGLDSAIRLELHNESDDADQPSEPKPVDSPSNPAIETISDRKTDEERDEVGITLGNLPSASSGVDWVTPGATLNDAVTRMLLNDYSQLAVMTNSRSIKGAVTWQSIARGRHLNGDAGLAGAIIPAESFAFDTELIDVLQVLQDRDFVFVKDASNLVTGIVTTADVVAAYGQLATPFFLIGELDQLLRRLLVDDFSWGEVSALCDKDGVRGLTKFEELTMGDYERVLENPSSWEALGWPLDRLAFTARLTKLRSARNVIMHFNPDPIPGTVVAEMRHMIKVLKTYG